MNFSLLASEFSAMESTSKRLELTDIIVRILKSTPKDIIDKVIYLMLGEIKPAYEGLELGIADKLALKAVSVSSGLPLSTVEEMYIKSGDIGDTAEEALSKRVQMIFFKEHLTVDRVYSTLERITSLKGEGAQSSKLRYLCNLLNDAEPIEGKYILKIITGKLRLR
jgi:DNA ligase-1